MTTPSEISDLPTVEQQVEAIGLRRLLTQLGAQGAPPAPAGAESVREQVPLLPSRTLREAVAKGFEVLSRAGLGGTLPRDLEPEGQHWHWVSTLALDELDRRAAMALEEFAAHPPAYLVAAIGRPDPGDLSAGASRGSWLAVTAHIMAYRLEYHISDPTRALGASPTSPVGLVRETDWRYVIGEIRWSAGNLGEHLVDPTVLAVFDATGRVDPQQALEALSGGRPGRARLSEAREQRVRALPSHALRTRVAQAFGLLRQRPADRSPELEQLQSVRDTIVAVYRQEVVAGAHCQPQQGDPHKTPAEQQRLSRRLDELDTAIAQVEGAQDQRRAWDARHADVLATGRLAAEELAGREREVLLAFEEDPPRYLVAELGRPPGDRAGRKIWRHGARIIERHRTRHEIDDPARPFGSHRDARQRAHLAAIGHQLDLVRDRLRLTNADLPALPGPPHGRIPGP